MSEQLDLLQGTLDLLILRTLELRPLHGVGVADRIEQVTSGVFVVGPGSLFPALHRLAAQVGTSTVNPGCCILLRKYSSEG